MTKWEDTVLKGWNIKYIYSPDPGEVSYLMSPQQHDGFEEALKAQAELSFKAGYEKRKSEEVTISLSEMLWEQRLRGRKEVVEFVENQGDWQGRTEDKIFIKGKIIPINQWQAQKKEWEVED